MWWSRILGRVSIDSLEHVMTRVVPPAAPTAAVVATPTRHNQGQARAVERVLSPVESHDATPFRVFSRRTESAIVKVNKQLNKQLNKELNKQLDKRLKQCF